MVEAVTRRAALVALASAVVVSAQATSPLKQAFAALDAGRWGEAVAQAKLSRVPKLADYAAWALASAQYELNNDDAALEALKPIWQQSPKSPLVGRASLLAAKTYIRGSQPQNAIQALKKYPEDPPQPESDMVLASAYEAAGDNRNAALVYQRVYYYYATTPAADTAQSNLERLHGLMGNDYPPAPSQQAFMRIAKLTDSGSTKKARRELEDLLPSLSGVDLDTARLRIGVTYHVARDNRTAFDYFRSLQVSAPEVDAERLYYVVISARRLDNLPEMTATLNQLAVKYPRSRWRAEALTQAANEYIVSNQPELYEPLLRACANEFPESPHAPNCHWRITFLEYMRRGPQAGAMLQEHLRRYPNSDHSSKALYFLGRLAEQQRDFAAARSYFDEINVFYPNYYYAVLARQRLTDPSVKAAAPSAVVNAALRNIAFPTRSRRLDFNPNPTAQARIDRAKLLTAAGLDDFADNELRYGANREDQPHVLAIALADSAMTRKMPERAIRYTKRYAAAHLFLPLDSAPVQFWKLSFPLPYRAALERTAKAQDLDPFFVAALVRQESEFDKDVVSHARAYGLTQVLPSTGRELSRRLGFKRYNAKMLFQPEFNLQLGTYYLRSMLGQLNNSVEATLAAYNAGKSRAVSWLSWYDYREPAEFVEMIPFSETRNYVQIVLRNADVYRRLYGGAGQ